ncbi:MAG: hypothetical protein U0105_03390 [Candidatus Obscuribacterales bacterium]
MAIMRPQWPHTLEDIVKSLDGTWGLVGATGTDGNLLKLERSLNEPLVYTLTEYEGEDEAKVLRTRTFPGDQKKAAVQEFARLLGFAVKA